MSYWIYLESDAPLEVANHSEGGTFALGGTNEPELNVTYNYAKHFDYRGELHGKTAAESVPALEAAVAKLGTKRASDYWASTPGNAGYACNILLGWAKQHPDATWRVS